MSEAFALDQESPSKKGRVKDIHRADLPLLHANFTYSAYTCVRPRSSTFSHDVLGLHGIRRIPDSSMFKYDSTVSKMNMKSDEKCI